MWYTIVTVIHVIVCFFLAIVVLLQQGKGSDAGAVFGGSSQTLFGSSGAGNLLTKLTSASAIIFMITSLTLTYGAAKQSTKSLFDSAPVSAPAPAATETAPAAQSATTPTEQNQPAASATVQPATEGQQATTTPSSPTPNTPSVSTATPPLTTTATPAPTPATPTAK